MKKIISALCVAILLFASSGIAASADSFTHKDEPNSSTTQALSRELYEATRTISAVELGLEDSLEEVSDLHCAANGDVYILLGNSSKVVVLNPDYTLKEILAVHDADDMEIDFSGAQGVYVDTNGDVYISDTGNSRILVTDSTGLFKESWELPDSPLIPDGFQYQPVKFLKDKDGYAYIISLGCYYGALAYSPEGEFMGFFGANRVTATALNTLSYLFDMITSNDTKKEASAKVLPYSFIDMALDADGYLTVCSGKTEMWSNGKGQIRKISSGGSNILLKRQSDGSTAAADSLNFLEFSVPNKAGKNRVQDLIAIDVSADDYIFALDRVYGLVYVYDNTCNRLGTFGGGIGAGTEIGEFVAPSAMALHGTSVLVADAKAEQITVFEQTEFGALYFQAQSLTLRGDYVESQPLWEQVVEQDASCQLAYRGLANAAYSNKDYEAALAYAKKGLDYPTYDLAWQVLIKEFIARYFIWFFAGAVLLIVGIAVLLVRLSKRKEPLIQNEKVKALLGVPAHPFRAFEDIKYKKRGSLLIALIIVLLFFFSKALEATSTGFLFCQNSAQTYNILFTMAQTIGLVLLWSIVNWLMCSLFSGKGTLKEIIIVTAYSLLPLVIYTFVYVGLSHILPLSGGALMGGIQTVLLIYTFYLLAVGMMTVHEYTFPKFLTTGVVTLICMILAICIGFIVVILLQQFWNFLYSIFMEIVFR
ncbi:MAG: YIP1 family protein [Clostridia bacterium]|nr:YIP1 family protein [Clostridia bacterium]